MFVTQSRGNGWTDMDEIEISVPYLNVSTNYLCPAITLYKLVSNVPGIGNKKNLHQAN